jgi:hypothetical protein
MDKHKQIGADRLAYAVAKLIQSSRLDSRSEAGDALLDYLEIGQPGAPHDVPTWMARYEALQSSAHPVQCQLPPECTGSPSSVEWVSARCTSKSCRGRRITGMGFQTLVQRGQEAHALCNECFSK